MDGKIKALITGLLFLIIGFIVVFNLLGATAPTLLSSAEVVNASGLPLASLYAPNGIVLMVFMAGIVVALVVGAFAIFKRGG